MADKYVEKSKIFAQMIFFGFRAPDMTVTEFVDDLPTADVAEVKHGHNLSNTPSYFVCSLCGDNCCDVYTWEPSQFNYCPNCGAKMDGGSE